MKRTSLAILAALACSSAPFLITQAFAQKTNAPSTLNQLDRFVGDAICTGNFIAMGKNPGHADTGKYHGEKTLDGYWIVVHYQQDQSAASPKPFEVVQYFGYDPASKRYITVMVGNGAGVHALGFSPGWKGNTITFDEVETARGKSHHTREAFTTGDTGLSGYTGWFRDQRGKWVKVDEETCRKA